MSWTAVAGFVAVAALTYVVPGPDFAVVVRTALRGWRPGLTAALGVQCGLLVHMTAAAAGLSVLLLHSAVAFTAVKVAGACYLVVLGVRAWWSTRGPAPEPSDEDSRAGFLAGLTTNVLNPKVALFFLSLVPQFVDTARPAAPQIVLLGVVDVALGLAYWTLVVVLSARFRAVMRTPRVRRRIDRVTGTVFVGAGAALAASH